MGKGGERKVLVVSTTFPQFEEDPRGAFIRAHWEAVAERGARVRMLVPHTRWCRGVLQSPLEVERVRYAPVALSSLTGHFGILENVRERWWRAALVPALWWSLARGIAAQISSFEPDLVVGHMMLPAGYLVARECSARGIPFEVHGHGTDVDLVLRSPAPLRARFAAAMRGAQRVAFCSRQKLDRAAPVLGLNEDQCAVETMAAGVVAKVAASGGERIRPERPTVLFVGRLIEQKGVDVLLDAAAKLPNVRVEIVGDGPWRGRLERQARALELDVGFHGYLSHARRDEFYRRASVLCVPSREREGLSEGAPLVVVEAQQFQLPVVASAVGGLPELCNTARDTLVQDGECPDALASALGRTLARETAPRAAVA